MSRIEQAMQKKAERDSHSARQLAERESHGRPGTLVDMPPDRGATPSVQAASLIAPEKVDEHIVSFHYPRSSLTENFKQILVVIKNMLPEGDDKVIMFTSSCEAEGKTTACLNFAVAVSQDASRRVIVVDADVREPLVHKLLGMKVRPGFGDLLVSDAPVGSVVVATPVPGLSAVLCGEIPPNPGELFGTERARQIFAELKEKYDCVVVDTPPVLPVVDTIHMAPFADGVVLVVEAARTSRKKVQRAIQLLQNANASVMGFILNKGPVAMTDSYSHYYRKAR